MSHVLSGSDGDGLPQPVVGSTDGRGGFALQYCIGRGSMGDVFEAVDQLLGTRVAIKILSPERLDARRRARFRREIEAVARLHHPGIVTVYDHGRVPDSEPVRALGVEPGAPWFAMELVEGATLAEVTVDRWSSLRAILLEILDALAHCHARGLVHCDLKPSNVLVPDASTLRGLKLSDFGISAVDTARATPHDDRELAAENVGGTPRYMAPEQLRALRHELGPWTDLYALGCLAWQLCTGHAPFGGRDLETLVAQHLHEPPPALVPSFALPRGVERWLLELLAKAPRARFASAAEARAALLAIDDDTSPGAPRTWPAPGLPAHWPDADAAPASSPLLRGLGLRLFGVREVPFAGRRAERETLWRRLREVADTGQTRVVVLHGAVGMGKTRLAETLVERALTLGVARAATCTHGPMPAPGDGLEAMVARLLRVQGLRRDEVAERIERVLGHGHAVPVSRFVDWLCAERPDDPAADEAPRVVRFSGLHERHLLLTGFLRALGRVGRPHILHIDDAQWGHETLAFVRHVLESQSLRGVHDVLGALFVITVDDELLEEQDRARATLEAIERDPATTTLHLGPLDDAEQRALVDGLLRLEPALVERVVAGAAGSPQFGVLLVDDWVHRGILRATAGGVVLSDEAAADPEIPTDIDALWQAQIAGALAIFPHDAGRGPLEIAAALGLRVDLPSWRAACRQAGTAPDVWLVDTLVGWRLARRMPDGWAFAHPAARDAVERTARDAGRWSAAHLACARMLEAYAGTSLAYGERLGRHLVAAGAGGRALLPLLRGAEHRRRLGDFEGALAVLDRRDAVLDLESWDRLPERVHGISLRARILATLSRLDEAVEVLDRVRRLDPGEHRLTPWWMAQVAYVHGLVEFKLGHWELARGHLDEALARWEALDDALGITETRILLAKLVRMLDLPRSVPMIEAALDAARRAQDALHYARAMMSLGEVHVRLGMREQGRRELERALELFEEIGNPERVAAVLNDLGEVARFDGDLELAERFYRRSQQSMLAARSRDATIPQLNLALVLIALDRPDEARRELEDALVSLERSRRPIYLLFVHINLAHIAAAHGDWARAEHHLDAFEVIFAEVALRDVDIARPARHLARLATAAGQLTLLRRAEAIVRAQG